MRITTARFPGKCSVCSERFVVGETIAKPNGGKWAHPNCAGARSNPGSAIPSDFAKADWEWGSEPKTANWTSYPEYSYDQFYRANPGRPSQPREPSFIGTSDSTGRLHSRSARLNPRARRNFFWSAKPKKTKKSSFPTFVVMFHDGSERMVSSKGQLEELKKKLGKEEVAKLRLAGRQWGMPYFRLDMVQGQTMNEWLAEAKANPATIVYEWDGPPTVRVTTDHPSWKRAVKDMKKRHGLPSRFYVVRDNPSAARPNPWFDDWSPSSHGVPVRSLPVRSPVTSLPVRPPVPSSPVRSPVTSLPVRPPEVYAPVPSAEEIAPEVAAPAPVFVTGSSTPGFYKFDAGPSIAEASRKPWKLPQNAGPYLPDMFPYGQGGRPYEYVFGQKTAKANPNFVGSGARGGFVADERDKLPSWYFLKPSTRGWPVGNPKRGMRDNMHAMEAIRYMNRGFGSKAEYPTLIKRLAKRYSPEDAANREIWTLYRKYRDGIDEKMSDAGVNKEMPSVASLRRRYGKSKR